MRFVRLRHSHEDGNPENISNELTVLWVAAPYLDSRLLGNDDLPKDASSRQYDSHPGR